jgi:hypothetical protein
VTKLSTVNPSSETPPSDTIIFGYYLVAFIDILGQRDVLRSLKGLPSNREEYQDFIRKVKDSYGAVEGLRQWHESFFEGLKEPSSYFEAIDENQRQLFRFFKRNSLKTRWFSDTALLYTPLANTPEHLPINAIYGILMWSATTMLTSLAAGRPVRGGIEIGVGAEIHEGEIYGPSLVSAYDLESKVADYPRIVVGATTIQYLASRLKPEENDIFAIYEKKLAETCLNLINVDTDGSHIVDYAGTAFRSLTKEGNDSSELLDKAVKFAREQVCHFQSEQNMKLLLRYQRLLDYLT